jgi:DNA helicase-2/ATP-dependent DNA helicase PcrA
MKESDDKVILSSWEKDWLNLSAFQLVKDILGLDSNTCKILDAIEQSYQQEVIATEKEVYLEMTGKKSQKKTFKGIFDRDKEILDEIFRRVERFDLSTKTREDLKAIGITSKHDLDLFENLYNIKQLLYDETIAFYEKPSVLEVYYDILQYSGILEGRLENPTEENQRILRNLGQITETIGNYEEIVTKYSMNGLLWFIFQEFDSYSTSGIPSDEIDKVQIMTVHKSKGLEFPVVILGSILEGKFPKVREDLTEAHNNYVNRHATYYTPPEYLEYKKEEYETEDGVITEDVIIEEDCWIGGNVAILSIQLLIGPQVDSSSAAPLGPIPFIPGILSELSPTIAQ